jgi:monoamine oxidase
MYQHTNNNIHLIESLTAQFYLKKTHSKGTDPLTTNEDKETLDMLIKAIKEINPNTITTEVKLLKKRKVYCSVHDSFMNNAWNNGTSIITEEVTHNLCDLFTQVCNLEKIPCLLIHISIKQFKDSVTINNKLYNIIDQYYL